MRCAYQVFDSTWLLCFKCATSALDEAFSTCYNNQKYADFTVCEEGAIKKKDNKKLGDIWVKDIPPAARGSATILITFSVDLVLKYFHLILFNPFCNYAFCNIGWHFENIGGREKPLAGEHIFHHLRRLLGLARRGNATGSGIGALPSGRNQAEGSREG